MPTDSTAERIAKAASLLLNLEGAEAVTMRRVARAVGITPMAVYRHYADRSGLLNALANAGFEELASRLKATPPIGDLEKRLKEVVDTYLTYAIQNPRLFELMFLKQREGARRFPRDFKTGRSPTANVAFVLIQEGMENGYFRKDDAWEIAFEIGALLQGLLMLFLGARMGMSRARFRAFCHRSIWRYVNGIRN